MVTEQVAVHIHPGSELSAALRSAVATGRAVLVDDGEARYELTVQPVFSRPSAEHVARTIAGIHKAAGRWQGLVDTDELINELYERRRMATRPHVEV